MTMNLNPREKLDWKDLDLFDSDWEKAIVLAAAAREEDPDWDKRIMAGEGLHQWRIEQLVVKPWGQYGKFHKGDCYLISKTDKNGLHDIHIWVGSESSRDEYAAAAYKMIQLDERLGGTAVQHKEVQGKESIKFLQYFKNSVTYLEGGVASGTADQKEGEAASMEPCLYRIKGTMQKCSLRLEQVPLRRDSLNEGDVFVLSVPTSQINKGQGGVWLWRGKSSNPDEKKKGMEVAESFCSSGETVTTLDQGLNDDEKSCALFWKYLPGKVAVLGPIKRSIHIQEADAKDDKGHSFVPILYEIRSPDNKLKKVCKARGIPVGPTHDLQLLVSRSKLKTERAYLLDTGFHVYIWWGLLYTGPKGNGESLAQQYLRDHKRPSLPIAVLKERQEVAGFSQHFHDGGGGCSCIIQ